MELWIRSQDKTKLVKVDNISYMDMAEDYEKEIHSLWNDCKGILGTYKTKERALEVLDEIQKLFSYSGEFEGSWEFIDASIKTLMTQGIFGRMYEMPEE